MRQLFFPAVVAALLMAGCGGSDGGPAVTITVPNGAGFGSVADTLVDRGVVGSRPLFTAYARLKDADKGIKSGRYRIPSGSSWGDVLSMLTEGRVETVTITVPEGFTLVQMAPRIAAIAEVAEDSVKAVIESLEPDSLGVPGPGLEGYLFPDTYRFAPGVAPEAVIRRMARRYRSMWTDERRALLDASGLSEREIVTLASIIQAEARVADEMPRISSVYHGRLRIGMRLQADPTVLYALGGRRERLLFAAIDSVQDNPYNTYSRAGLPPGPIGAPGKAALDAALEPAEEDFVYFVARPDGSHIFTRTLAEHNQAVAEARREWDTVAVPDGGGG